MNDRIVLDPRLPEAVDYIFEIGFASASLLKRKLDIGYVRAGAIIDCLEKLGLISPHNPYQSREILMSSAQWSQYLSGLNYEFKEPEPVQNSTQSPSIDEITLVDKMDGYSFELLCCNLLKKNGFINVFHTTLSGDNGIDIIAEKNDIKYGIQCKCYSDKLGNKCVQEAYTGLAMYNCDIGAVLTNNYFTDSAIETAKKTRIRLWDRDYLIQLIKTAKQ